MSAEQQNPPGSGPGRRRSFFRRYVVRTVLWALAGLAVLALLAGRLIDTRPARDRLRHFAETRISDRLGVGSRIGDLDLDLLPLELEVFDLEIDDTAGGRFAALPHGIVRAHVQGLFQPTITLYRVELEGPEIDIRVSEDGTSNVPRLRPRKKRATIRLRELRVTGGEARVDHLRVPLELDAEGVVADLVGLGRDAIQGDLRLDRLQLGTGEGVADLGTVELRARTLDGGIEIETGTVAGPDLGGRFEGGWSWVGERSGEVEVDAEIDTELLRRLGLVKTALRGDLRYVGSIGREGGEWSAAGELSSPAIRVSGRDFRDASARVRVSPEAVEIPRLSAGYASGRLSGSARVELADRRLTELDLRVSGVDARRLLEIQGAPVRGVASTIAGDLRYRFYLDAPRAGDGWGQFRFAPAAPGESAEVPMDGEGSLLIDNGVVEIRALRLRGSSQRLDAAGRYDLETRTGQFQADLATEAPRELAGLAATPIELGAWYPTAGRGTVRSLLRLEPDRFSALVDLELQQVVAPGYQADDLTGSFEFSPNGIRGLRVDLNTEESLLVVSGAIPFGKTSELPDPAAVPASGPPAVDLVVEAVEWPSRQFDAWLPIDVPIEGSVTGTLELDGPVDAISGRAELGVAAARRNGTVLGDLGVVVRFDPSALEIDSLELGQKGCQLATSGRLGWLDGGLDLELGSTGCRLEDAPFAALVPTSATGTVDVEATVGGSLEKPEVAGRIVVAELATPDLDLENRSSGSLEFAWRDSDVRVEGGVPGVITASGGGLADAVALDLAISVQVSDLAPVLALAGAPYLSGLDGDATGQVRIRADADGGWAPEVDLESEMLRASYEGRELRNLEPIEVAWSSQELSIGSLFLGDEAGASDLFVSGTATLSSGDAPSGDLPSSDRPGSDLALNLQASLDAGWLALVVPDLDVRGGRFDVLANIGGTFTEPRLAGQASLDGGQLVLPGGVLSLDTTEGLVLFYPEQVVLDRLTARAAGGRMLASGRVGLPTTTDALSYRFQVSTRDFSLRYPEGWLLSGDTELVVSSLADGRRVEGSIQLDRALYSRDVSLGLAQLMQVLFERQRVEVEEVDEVLAETQLSLLVEGERALRVRNNLADLYGRADLVVRGTAARPIVFGEVELEREGTLEYSGTEYSIERGLLSFVNPYRIEPVIDLVANATTREYKITMNLTGPVDKINATFTSDPPLADLEILSLLAAGDTGAGDPGGSGLDAGSILYGQAASLIADRANELFGFDKLRIDPLTGESGRLSAARVTVGKQLSRDIYATYSYDPTATEEQILQLEWQIDRDFALVFTQNGDGTYAADAQWEKHF